jgi:hypothetical protein
VLTNVRFWRQIMSGAVQPLRIALCYNTGSLILEYVYPENKRQKPRHRKLHLNEFIQEHSKHTDDQLIQAIKRDVVYGRRHRKYFEKVKSSQLDDVLVKLIHHFSGHSEQSPNQDIDDIANELNNFDTELGDDFVQDSNDDPYHFDSNVHDNFDTFDDDFEQNFGGHEDNFVDDHHHDNEFDDDVTETVYNNISGKDLNKVSEDELADVKAKMDVVFEKNRKTKRDEGYQYDLQVDFKPTQSSEWDD